MTSHAEVTPKCCDMERHARKFLEKLSEAVIYRLHTMCRRPPVQKTKTCWKQWDIKKKPCSHIVLKCLNLARIGRPDTLWSLHCLSRAITKWNKACDKCLAKLSSGINCTSGYRQYCGVGNTASPCTFGAFQESDLIGDQAGSKSMSGGMFMHLG